MHWSTHIFYILFSVTTMFFPLNYNYIYSDKNIKTYVSKNIEKYIIICYSFFELNLKKTQVIKSSTNTVNNKICTCSRQRTQVLNWNKGLGCLKGWLVIPLFATNPTKKYLKKITSKSVTFKKQNFL